MGLTGDDMSADELWDLGGREAVVEHLRDLADERLEARERPRSARRTGRQVERFVLLRTIDSLWVEHLTELDDMRRGIGLRGYAQQDPLNEFRREAYRLYEELRGLIRHGVASTIFRVTVQRQPPPEAALATLAGAGRRGARRAGRNGRGRHGPQRWRVGRRVPIAAASRPGPCRRPARHARSPSVSAGRRCGTSAHRSATSPSRSSVRRTAAARPAARGPATRRPASGSAATTRAGAARARSTRSATAADG